MQDGTFGLQGVHGTFRTWNQMAGILDFSAFYEAPISAGQVQRSDVHSIGFRASPHCVARLRHDFQRFRAEKPRTSTASCQH